MPGCRAGIFLRAHTSHQALPCIYYSIRFGVDRGFAQTTVGRFSKKTLLPKVTPVSDSRLMAISASLLSFMHLHLPFIRKVLSVFTSWVWCKGSRYRTDAKKPGFYEKSLVWRSQSNEETGFLASSCVSPAIIGSAFNLIPCLKSCVAG